MGRLAQLDRIQKNGRRMGRMMPDGRMLNMKGIRDPRSLKMEA